MGTDAEKLRARNPEELVRESHELRAEIWKLRVQRATGQLPHPEKIRVRRRELARVLTVLRERELKLKRSGETA